MVLIFLPDHQKKGNAVAQSCDLAISMDTCVPNYIRSKPSLLGYMNFKIAIRTVSASVECMQSCSGMTTHCNGDSF